MKSWISSTFGDLDGLSLLDSEFGELGDDEVQINVAACGINFPDLLILDNKYQFKPELPFTPGGEVTGIIARVGANVKNFYLGQRVFAIERWGGLSEKMKIHKDRLAVLPDEIDLVSGAALLYNLSTAFYALKNRGKVKPGESILILGAAGGVGIAGIQLSKAMGLKVIAAAGSTEKLALCKEAGADELINYCEENIKDKINTLTEKKGVNVVLDTVGGAYAELAVRALAWEGRYLIVGFAAGNIPSIPLNLLLLKGAELKGVFWGKFSRDEPAKQNENLQEIFELVKTCKVKPFIGKTYAFEEANKALLDLKNRNVRGKAVVICNERIVEKDNQQVRPAEKKDKFIFLSKEHIVASVGQDLGESKWFQVTQSVIDDFARSTDDFQWIHVEPDLADKSEIGSTIAHGFLTISLSPKFLNEIYEMPFISMGVNYGVDKLRFIQPVKVNSKLKMDATLISAEPVRNNGLKLRMKVAYFVEGNARTVCTAELLSVVY